MDNSIQTWSQGFFCDGLQYRHMDEGWKRQQEVREKTLVRPSTRGNAICQCVDPNTAMWVAGRLNLASKLERKISGKGESVQTSHNSASKKLPTRTQFIEWLSTFDPAPSPEAVYEWVCRQLRA